MQQKARNATTNKKKQKAEQMVKNKRYKNAQKARNATPTKKPDKT